MQKKGLLLTVGSSIPDAVTKSSNSSFQIHQRCERVVGLPVVSNAVGPVDPLDQMALAQNF